MMPSSSGASGLRHPVQCMRAGRGRLMRCRGVCRNVLTDPELLRALAGEGILCWGGDVRERDAYLGALRVALLFASAPLMCSFPHARTVGKTIQYHALPCIAFLALQPSSSPVSTSSPRMAIITRLEGPTACAAPAVLAHLTTIVLPRVSPFLARLRAQAASRDAERRIREEQDRAYRAAALKDTERVLKVRREEERKKLDLVERVRRDEDKANRERERQERKEKADAWRAWRRIELEREGDEPAETEVGIARIGVRLGDGRRAVRRFRREDTIEKVYAFVECALSPALGLKEVGGRVGRAQSPPRGYVHVYEFELATTFPRFVLDVGGSAVGTRVGEVEGLAGGSVNLTIEGLEKRRRSMGEMESDEEEEEEEAEE